MQRGELGRDDHLERAGVGRVREGFVRIEDLLECETMGNQKFGIEPAGAQRFQQHRRTHGVDEPRGDRDIPVPQVLQMKIDLHAMHADVRDRPARRDDRLAQFEGGGVCPPLQSQYRRHAQM